MVVGFLGPMIYPSVFLCGRSCPSILLKIILTPLLVPGFTSRGQSSAWERLWNPRSLQYAGLIVCFSVWLGVLLVGLFMLVHNSSHSALENGRADALAYVLSFMVYWSKWWFQSWRNMSLYTQQSMSPWLPGSVYRDSSASDKKSWKCYCHCHPLDNKLLPLPLQTLPIWRSLPILCRPLLLYTLSRLL